MRAGRTKYVYEAKVDNRGEQFTMTFVTDEVDSERAFRVIHQYCLDIHFTLIRVGDMKVALELS